VLKTSFLEPSPMPQFCLLGLSGSLRRASNSTAVLRGLRDALGLRAALDIFPLHAIPLYNTMRMMTPSTHPNRCVPCDRPLTGAMA
jgi:hypothetical protein